MNALLVIAGGGAGAYMRYLSSRAVNDACNSPFAWGTIVVNCAGSLLIGFLAHFLDTVAPGGKWKLLVITGFLGGYTTFSAYAFETVCYAMNGKLIYAALNMAVTNALCITFTFAGVLLYKAFFLK